MSQLAFIAVALGCLLIAWHFFIVLRPQVVGAWIRRLPRSVLAGRIFTAIDLIWITVFLWNSDIKWIAQYQPFLVLIAVIVFILIITFVDEFLAVRALGGLFLLAPLPILKATFLQPPTSRLVMTLFAYLLVILGIIWVWSPFMFRKMTSRWIASARMTRLVGACGILIGLIMILLGFFVY